MSLKILKVFLFNRGEWGNDGQGPRGNGGHLD